MHMATIEIPKENWSDALIAAVKTARPGDIIIVHSPVTKELAETALHRLKREGVTVQVKKEKG